MRLEKASDLLPGDVGFSVIPGTIGGWVNIGQALLRDSCVWTHAYLVLPDGMLIEAIPSGARIVPVADRFGPDYAYARLPLTLEQRAKMGSIGEELEGTPYSFADYLALAALEWHLPTWRWLREYVSSSGHMICSQLVDYALCRAGFHLFDDGRLPQDVTPGALYWRCARIGSVYMD
ncbi:MAG TPA: hypothetical protein VFU47_14275 [Armatimonadota bacterium]|nr:hypothetical protein [Armatimonadota bacterium]